MTGSCSGSGKCPCSTWQEAGRPRAGVHFARLACAAAGAEGSQPERTPIPFIPAHFAALALDVHRQDAEGRHLGPFPFWSMADQLAVVQVRLQLAVRLVALGQARAEWQGRITAPQKLAGRASARLRWWCSACKLARWLPTTQTSCTCPHLHCRCPAHLRRHQHVAPRRQLHPVAAHHGAVDHEAQGIEHIGFVCGAAVVLAVAHPFQADAFLKQLCGRSGACNCVGRHAGSARQDTR